MELLDELKTKIEDLQSKMEVKRQELATALINLDAISKDETLSDDERTNKSSAAQSTIDSISKEIDELKTQANEYYETYKRLNPDEFSFGSNILEGDKMGTEDLLRQLEENSKAQREGSVKRTPGQYIADYLIGAGVKSADDFDALSRQGRVKFVFNFDSSDVEAVKEVKSLTSIKSLYQNGGEVLLDGGNPVPGFQGYGCGVFEVQDECELCIQPRNFTDVLTIRNMPAAGVIQYDYPVSRDDQASGVLESVYNPYPTLVQDGTKPEGTFDFNTAKVKVSKIAEFVTASDEVLEDCGKISQRIDRFLESSLLKERDRQLIAGTGTFGSMVGLLNQPGVLSLNGTTLTTAAGTATPNIWDKIYLAMLELDKECAVVDAVIVNPSDRAKVALAKDANGNYLFPQDGCQPSDVGCLTLKTSPDVPAGTAIVGELKDNWVFYLRKNLTISMGMTGNQFIENSKTILGELRGAVVLFCPSKVAIVSNI